MTRQLQALELVQYTDAATDPSAKDPEALLSEESRTDVLRRLQALARAEVVLHEER